MQITEMELIFLNSITPGTHIWGIPLRVKRTEKFSETCQITIESLIQKKLLESEVQLSALGVAAAKLIDDYKHAEKHVLINRMHLALLPNMDTAIIVQTNPGKYEILRQNRTAILVETLRNYQELCAVGDRRTQSRMLSPEKFLQEIQEYPNNLLLGKFERNRSMEEGILFWNERKIYYYDVKKEKRRLLSAPQARNLLAEILELKEEFPKGNRD